VLRTVTFSDGRVARELAKDFVCAWKNRKSGFHNCDPNVERGIFERSAEAFPTMNIVTLFLTPDLQVLHYVSGYFAPGLFLEQVQTARRARDAAESGGLAAFQRVHAEAAERLKGGSAGEDGLEYRGMKHVHGEACRWARESAAAYLSMVHGDLAGRKDVDAELEQITNSWANDNRRGGWRSLKRVSRTVAAYAGERRAVEGLKLLSEVEGAYLYGNAFTEE